MNHLDLVESLLPGNTEITLVLDVGANFEQDSFHGGDVELLIVYHHNSVLFILLHLRLKLVKLLYFILACLEATDAKLSRAHNKDLILRGIREIMNTRRVELRKVFGFIYQIKVTKRHLF